VVEHVVHGRCREDDSRIDLAHERGYLSARGVIEDDLKVAEFEACVRCSPLQLGGASGFFAADGRDLLSRQDGGSFVARCHRSNVNLAARLAQPNQGPRAEDLYIVRVGQQGQHSSVVGVQCFSFRGSCGGRAGPAPACFFPGRVSRFLPAARGDFGGMN